ncbi:unannotated protein [freshwater metagenome]|uniref:Unannotated protein n=1 Tax=freshwater metagenome TaxID=449393 RepID=A0A6J6K1A1_9ZZZZ
MSIFVTTINKGCPDFICFTIYSSPAPISSSAGKQRIMLSVESIFSLTIEFNLVPRAVFGLCIPGVSTNIIW